jgi:hypothetical protein
VNCVRAVLYRKNPADPWTTLGGMLAQERAGLSTLNENQVVEYDLVENRGKSSAENLKVS